MKRSTWISLIDVMAFVSFLFLIVTGILLRYVLPPGSGGLVGEGHGWKAATRPVSVVWGLTRHEWGAIHFWIAVAFLVVIAIHLFIHWKWIVVSVRGRDRRESRLQGILGIAALLGLIGLALVIVLGPKQHVPRQQLLQQRSTTPPADAGER